MSGRSSSGSRRFRSASITWRKLTAGQQALLVLAHLRNGDTYARLAAGFGVGLATVYRYVREATDLLAARAPSLTAALWRLAGNGHRLGCPGRHRGTHRPAQR